MVQDPQGDERIRNDLGGQGEAAGHEHYAHAPGLAADGDSRNYGTNGDDAGRPAYRRGALVVFLLLFCLLLGVLGGVGLYVANGFSPVATGRQVQVTIPKGASSKDIAERLQQQGIIKDAFLFTLYLRLHQDGTDLQAGVYELQPGMTLDAIIAKLRKGDTVKPAVIKVTIPEGDTIAQIAEILSAAHVVDRAQFLQLCNEPDQFDFPFTALIPKNRDIKYALEGYLFPDTYEFPPNAGAKEAIRTMLANTARKLDGLPPDWQSRMKTLGLTFHQMLTVASLVEREVVVPKERPLVASVIYNRLKKPMNLQMDCTIQYILGKQKARVMDADTRIKDPYNTYLNPGLPPGPIASPSLSSIQAALYPAKTDYYYYVTKKDGSGEQYFASTYSEHLRNIRKSEEAAAAGSKSP